MRTGTVPLGLAAIVALGLAIGGAPADGAAAPPPRKADEQWLTALIIRSDALNRIHGLGKYAPGDPRSDALNRIHRLGS